MELQLGEQSLQARKVNLQDGVTFTIRCWSVMSTTTFGVAGVGKKNAERILKGATNRADLHQRVENEYKRVYGSDWDRVMLENGRLLYLQRKPDDEWSLNI